jgi:hypothetical protein
MTFGLLSVLALASATTSPARADLPIPGVEAALAALVGPLRPTPHTTPTPAAPSDIAREPALRDARTPVIPPEPTRVTLPPRPRTALGEFAIALPVPLIRQLGDKSNCGPTAAAMALGAYQGDTAPAALRDLRNAIGEWTWQRFPRRQRRHDGSDAGGTTRLMMQQSLDRFGDARWQPVTHSWLPREIWSLVALKRHLAERRPVVVLAEAAPLWGSGSSGLHWVVAVGFQQGKVLMHDPADGRATAVPLARFWRAWRLPERYRPVPGITGFEALVADRSLPVVLPSPPPERHVAHEALFRF